MLNFLKKLLKLFTSRLAYLLAGLSFALVVIIAQAAITSTDVAGGTRLTSGLWNGIIDDLEDLDGRTIGLDARVATLETVLPNQPCGNIDHVVSIAPNGWLLCLDPALHDLGNKEHFMTVDKSGTSNIALATSGARHCCSGTSEWRCLGQCHRDAYWSICDVSFRYNINGVNYNTRSQCLADYYGNNIRFGAWSGYWTD